jgi:hypothetical protein
MIRHLLRRVMLRLKKTCVYEEDTIPDVFVAALESSQPPGDVALKPVVELPSLGFAVTVSEFDPLSHESLRRSTMDIAVRMQAIRILDSVNMPAVSAEFFAGTHQRLSALSKSRFYRNLPSLNIDAHADFVVLCLCIYLIQQIPTAGTTSMQSSLYAAVKSLISLLEAGCEISLDTVHCRLLLTLYELGHGLTRAAYISIAACARSARVLGLHKKPWLNSDRVSILATEEEKRLWWAIVNADRLIGLLNGDALFVTEDPASSDPLPIQDSLWLADSLTLDIEAPILATPAHVTIGQLARECQVAHLTGRVVKHVFDPTPDLAFNKAEAVQLERTLRAFLPLLVEEDLRLGKYCGALGICHRSVTLLTPSENESRGQVLLMYPALFMSFTSLSKVLPQQMKLRGSKSWSLWKRPLSAFSLTQKHIILTQIISIQQLIRHSLLAPIFKPGLYNTGA